MKIAFTSCADPLDAPRQQVWQTIRDQNPDHLILLGDQIYMDYGIHTKNFPLGTPVSDTDVPPDLFAKEVHRRYHLQWQLMRDSGLFNNATLGIHGIWDDHDFGANNSCGSNVDGLKDGKIKNQVYLPVVKQRISRRLFRDFFASLTSSTYPANPYPDGKPDGSDDMSKPVFYSSSIDFTTWPANGVVALTNNCNLYLLDGRSFRDLNAKTMLGQAQAYSFFADLKPNSINLVASSVTLTQDAEGWHAYPIENDRLTHKANESAMKILILTGDNHNTDLNTRSKPFEVVASGAARPFGNALRPGEGNFGIIDLSDLSLVKIDAFEANRKHKSVKIKTNNWSA